MNKWRKISTKRFQGVFFSFHGSCRRTKRSLSSSNWKEVKKYKTTFKKNIRWPTLRACRCARWTSWVSCYLFRTKRRRRTRDQLWRQKTVEPIAPTLFALQECANLCVEKFMNYTIPTTYVIVDCTKLYLKQVLYERKLEAVISFSCQVNCLSMIRFKMVAL